MHDLDTRITNAILRLSREKVFGFLNMGKITPDLFITRIAEYKYLRRFILKNGMPPSKTLFKRRFPSFPLLKVKDPLDELMKELLRRTQQNHLADFVNKLDPEDINEKLEDYVKDVGKLAVTLSQYDMESTDHEYVTSFDQRWQQYQDRKEGLSNVTFTTGIPQMDAFINGGMSPSNLVVVAGDPKMGKTWFLCNMIRANYKAGKTILLISPEMTSDEIMTRLDCMQYEIPHHMLLAGTLTKKQEARWRNRKHDKQPLHIVDTTEALDFTPSGVMAKVNIYHPDIVLIDSAYYLKADGADPRREESYLDRQRLVKQLKAVAKERKIPVVCVVQMKAETEKTKEVGEAALRGVYGGDHWAQGCDLMFRLRGSRADSFRRLVLLANREGETFKEALIKYEFDPCPNIYGIDALEEVPEDSEDAVEVQI